MSRSLRIIQISTPEPGWYFYLWRISYYALVELYEDGKLHYEDVFPAVGGLLSIGELYFESWIEGGKSFSLPSTTYASNLRCMSYVVPHGIYWRGSWRLSKDDPFTAYVD